VASQYTTDLQKCILRVEEYECEANSDGDMDLIILGGLSGRLDQTMHTLHVLCQLVETETEKNIVEVAKKKQKRVLRDDEFATLERRRHTWVVSDNSLVWILSKVSSGEQCVDEKRAQIQASLLFCQGTHTITVDLNIFGQTCGVMPFASQVHPGTDTGTRIWTEGLEWDMGE
jgi:hypothetical protein